MLGITGKFLCESALLLLFSVFLYRWLLTGVGINLHKVLLVGLVCGTLFRSLSSLMQRLLSPGEFAVLQGRVFATFTRAAPEIIALSTGIIILVAITIWRMRHCLDIIALGRNTAINLGVAYQKNHHYLTIGLIAGRYIDGTCRAVNFLGLLIANLAYPLVGSFRHQYLLPGVFLLGVITLVGGQLILERLLNMSGTLSVVIEFVGGALFIYLLIKRLRCD